MKKVRFAKFAKGETEGIVLYFDDNAASEVIESLGSEVQEGIQKQPLKLRIPTAEEEEAFWTEFDEFNAKSGGKKRGPKNMKRNSGGFKGNKRKNPSQDSEESVKVARLEE